MSSFHKLSVKNIKRETDKAISISFNLPENLKDTFAFQAGQYITLKTDINGNEVRRDYSLCVSPKSGDLKIAVKEVKDGTFSAYANNTLNPGDTLEVAPPKGRFVFEPNDSKTKNIALFAAGSESRIHFELFKAAKLAEVKEDAPAAAGSTKITVTVDDETTTFEMSQKQTILEAALDEDFSG